MGKGFYLGELEQVVLLSLARLSGNGYGMEVYDEIRDVTDRDVSIPTIYVTLTRLEQKGMVSSRTGKPTAERGGRAKKFFRLERAGVEALRRSREQLDKLWLGVKLSPSPRRP